MKKGSVCMDKIPLVDLKANYESIKEAIDSAIQDVINSSSFIMGKYVQSFEREYSYSTNSKFCISTSNGTASILIALQALGLKPGDEVITVPNTFIATTEAITLIGGKIKFVDVEEKTLLMNHEILENHITKKTKVIIPVHLFGQLADMDKIKEIGDKHNLKIVEDVAQAHFATYKGKQPGYYGDMACYSFFPAKNLGCFGDGGSVTTNNEVYAKKMAMLRDHGRVSKYEHLIEGFNFRMDALQAAILSVKLKYVDRWTNQRRENAKLYNKLLSGIVQTPYEAPYRKHVYYAYQIMLEKRDEMQKYLEENGISCGVYYPIPLHLQKAYEYLNLKNGAFPVVEDACNKLLALPMYPELNEEQINYICNKIIEGIKNHIQK